MSDQIQSPGSIGPMQEAKQEKEEIINDPARADYKSGREFLSKGEYGQAAMALHNALRGF